MTHHDPTLHGSTPVIDTVVDELINRGATNRLDAIALLPALERELGPLTDAERQAALSRTDTLITERTPETELGLNPVVDDISAEALNRLHKELAGLIPDPELREAVLGRIAPAMHDATSAGYAAGNADGQDDGEAIARGVVPDEML